MFSILGKIIAKEWIRSISFILVVLFLLVSIGDIVNGFLQGFEAQKVFITFLLKLPGFIAKILPISCMLATMFSLSSLKESSTLMAILASGYNYRNILFIILFCSGFVFILQIFNLAFLEPMANRRERIEDDKTSKMEMKYLARSRMGSAKVMWYKTDKYFASFQVFDRNKKMVRNLSVYYYEDNRIKEIIKSKMAFYDANNKWDLKGVTILSKLNQLEFPLQEKKEFHRIKLGEAPADFEQFESDLTTLNLFQLSQFVRSLEKTDIQTSEYEIIFWEKIAAAISCFIFALIPFSIIYNPNRRSNSLGKNILISLIFTIIYWLLSTTFINIGSSGKIPPAVAAMIIPLFFLIISMINFYRHRKLI